MEDDDTGTWWQQSSGRAIVGPLRGKRLQGVYHDQLSFGIWKNEQPNGRVLRPEPARQQAGKYSIDFEKSVEKMTAFPLEVLNTELEPNTIIYGVSIGGIDKAYPFSVIQRQSPLVDYVGGTPIVIVLAADGKSVRVFNRDVDGRELELFKRTEGSSALLVDSATKSEWDFSGEAISGPFKSMKLQKIFALRDSWFNWRYQRPETEVYLAGSL